MNTAAAAPPTMTRPHHPTVWRSSSASSCRAMARRTSGPCPFIQLQQQQPSAGPPSATASPAAATAARGTYNSSIDGSDTLSLDNVRTSLIRQEETIIFSIIERAQFAFNAPVYQPGGVPVPAYAPDGRNFTLLEYLLRDTEAVHGRIRRYTSPDEHAFYPDALPPMVLPPMVYEPLLHPHASSININADVMDMYLNKLLPRVTQPGDDSNYGSAAMYDVLCLQALSKRIHHGKFVAEAKFRAAPEEYTHLIRAQDAEGLMDLLTFPGQEARVVERVRLKAATFGQDIDMEGAVKDTHYKVKPEVVAALYRDAVMPMTKRVQVAYLLRRLD